MPANDASIVEISLSEMSILLPAFLAGLLVLVTHVPLGQLVLQRGIVFIDLAIAQVAGFGVVAADAMGWEPRGWSVQISAVSAALVSAAFLLCVANRNHRRVGSQSSDGRARNDCNRPDGSNPQSLRLSP
jgi:ABC-type Mn2+/Zn2+ transport system permease subunit